MSYQTLEVELDHGQIRPNKAETLPVKAHALLNILEARNVEAPNPVQSPGAGLRRFLSQHDFPLTPDQFRTSMAADFWEKPSLTFPPVRLSCWTRTFRCLLTNDSLHLAAGLRGNISTLATNDACFDLVPGLTLFKPDDLG